MNALTPEQREVVARLQSGRLMICDGQGDPNSDGCGGQGYTGAAGQEPCPHCYGAGVMTPELRAVLFSASSEAGCHPTCRPAKDLGVHWSAWPETDADSDPSDPGVSYCTEWFVGRWPIGAEEPDCRILIGTSRSAEIIARRVAENLTSVLNTDAIRAGVNSPSPDPAGAGGDLGEQVKQICLDILDEHHGRQTPIGVDAASFGMGARAGWDAAAAEVISQIGKLVASTGSGEETKGATPMGSGSHPSDRTPSGSAGYAVSILRARPLSEWTEEDGTVLWWCFPIDEPPYVGSPLDLGHQFEVIVRRHMQGDEISSYDLGGWPGYHTHWTPISVPDEPPAPCDGSAEGGETGTGSTEGNSAVDEVQAPKATPKSSPDQTPADTQMPVEEAREIIDRLFDHKTPEEWIEFHRLCADYPAYTAEMRASNAKWASCIEAALRTLQSSDAPSSPEADR